MNIVLRDYMPGDELQIVPELVRTFDEWESRKGKALQYWRWQYSNQPQLSKRVSVAVDGDDVIGVNHALCLKVKVVEKVLTACYGTDVYIKEEYRGKGLLTQLRQHKINKFQDLNVDYAYLYTDNPIVIDFQKKRAKSFSFPISRYLNVKDVDLHVITKSSQYPWFNKIAYQVARAINRGTMEHVKDFQIERVYGFDDAILDFWEKVSDHYDYIIIRDKEYLNWRYCNPLTEYIVLVAKDGDAIIGYSVICIMSKQRDYPEGYILDFLILPGYSEAGELLISRGLEHLEKLGVNAVHIWAVKNHETEKILNTCGFVDTRTNNHIFYMFTSEKDPLAVIKQSTANRIHFCYGDLFLV